MVSQVVYPPPVPAVIVNDPAESVELLATVAVGDVPQLDGVPIVGLFVWVDLKCASLSVKVLNVEVVPATVNGPLKVEVTPVRPIVIPELFAVPIEIVPAVPLAVPTSIVTLPELPALALPDLIEMAPVLVVPVPDCRLTAPEAPAEALPDRMLTALLVVPAAVWIVP